MRRLLSAFFALSVFMGLVSLGFWQISRAHEKERLLADFAFGESQAALTLEAVLAHPQDFRYRTVKLSGHFIENQDILWINQTDERGRAGVYVLSLWQEDSGHLVWVNRGFLALHQEIPPPGQVTSLYGIIMLPDPRRFIIGPNIIDPQAKPLTVQRFDSLELGQQLGHVFPPVLVAATSDLSDALVREWTITVMPPDKHYAYALQWFGLAIAWGVMITVAIWKKGVKCQKRK